MFDWPVATVLLGSLATAAVGILKWKPRRGDELNGRIYARATDLAEIGARLSALESAHHTLRFGAGIGTSHVKSGNPC